MLNVAGQLTHHLLLWLAWFVTMTTHVRQHPRSTVPTSLFKACTDWYWTKTCVLCRTYCRYHHWTRINVLTIISAIQQTKLCLSSTIKLGISLFEYGIYFSMQCASPEEWITYSNKLIFHIMGKASWNVAHMMAEIMMRTMVLVWWRYLEYLLGRDNFFLGIAPFDRLT